MSLDEMYAMVKHRTEQRIIDSRKPTQIRIWDGNWNLIGEVSGEYEHRFRYVELDAGDATIQLPMEHWIAEMLIDEDQWPTKSLYMTFDRDGCRWSGRVENKRVVFDAKQGAWVEFNLVHDYKKLKEILVWANPFLPAEVQFPKSFILFGPARWVVTTTLFLSLIRKNNSIWMVPDNPVDASQWFDLDMSNWNIAVKPVNIFLDDTLPTVVNSRFKNFHDCVKDVCEDARLSIQVRRYLDGDPEPWPGAKLRHGCLVVDVVDKAGMETGTGLLGSLTKGITHGIRMIGSDGLTEGYEFVPRVDSPEEYSKPDWKGTNPSAPWVVLEHGPFSNIETSDYEYVPPGPSQFVTGGSSMPYVNEGIKSAIIGFGGFLGAMVGMSQAGSVAAEILEPLYSDVFMAFQAHKMHARIKDQGWDFPFEYWVDGADKAYTIAAIVAMRQAKEATRERRSVKVKMTNGFPYFIGESGFGDFFIGDRVACHALGMAEDKLFLENVRELEYVNTVDDKGWEIELGQQEFSSGFSYLVKLYERHIAGMKELGIW